jgi:adenosylcobinamide-GDP ribazoletransferase
MQDETEMPPAARNLLRDIGEALRFLTRLPLSAKYGVTQASAIARSAWAFPLVGALIGALSVAVLIAAGLLNLYPTLAAVLAVIAALLLTGGLHEDGLADTIDGLGGSTRTRKLEIMRDSRIGTYGAMALILVLFMRIGAINGLLRTPEFILPVLVAGEAISRALMVLLWHVMPPATDSGLSVDAGTPTRTVTAAAVAIGCAAIVAAGLILPWQAILTGSGLAVAAVFTMSIVNMRTLGGRTGDTLGASQQVALAAFLSGAVVT